MILFLFGLLVMITIIGGPIAFFVTIGLLILGFFAAGAGGGDIGGGDNDGGGAGYGSDGN